MNIQNAFFLLFITTTFSSAGQVIEVDAGRIVKEFATSPAGINLNYLMDDDSYLEPEIPLTQTLSMMNVGWLRYPGGEKSDNYLWSNPPYDSAYPAFAVKGNCNWPNTDSRFSLNGYYPKATVLDFDEFMDVCMTTGAEPLIVVSGDAHYCDICTNVPTREELITNAVEWVRYANRVKNHRIRYWMVGNESYHSAAYGTPPNETQYAHDFTAFATAMKEVDSSIQVVGNVKPGYWTETLLVFGKEVLDAVAMSVYPIWDWKNGYEVYRTSEPDFVSSIQSVVNSIGIKDIRVIVSEFGTIDWSGSWPGDNDLGHALVSFQMFGDIVKVPKVDQAFLWNTRWIDNPTKPQQVTDAIDSDGYLNATGKALSLWGEFLLERLVYSTNSGFIRSFAFADSSGSQLTIFLINKDTDPHPAEVRLTGSSLLELPSLVIMERILSGESPADLHPVIYEPEHKAMISEDRIQVQMQPLSIHVIRLDASATGAGKRWVPVDEGFRLWPNPVKDLLHVETGLPGSGTGDLRLYCISGKQVRSWDGPGNHFALDVRDLSPGIYVLFCGTEYQMVIKQ